MPGADLAWLLIRATNVAVRSTVGWTGLGARRDGRTGQIKGRFPNRFLGDRPTVGVSRRHAGRRFDPAHTEGAASCREVWCRDPAWSGVGRQLLMSPSDGWPPWS